jgi:hypothetical protein
MRSVYLRRFHAVQCVLDFCREFPDRTPAAMAALACLERVGAQVRVLLNEDLLAEQEATTNLERRNQILIQLRQGMAHLVRLARVVSAHEAVADLLFKVVFGRAGLGGYFLAARAALATADTHRALLLKYGMPSDLLEDLARDLDRCVAAQEGRERAEAAGKRIHADFTALAQEAIRITRHLDALNRIRFANEPGRLAEWDAAKRQATGDRRQATTAGEGR